MSPDLLSEVTRLNDLLKQRFADRLLLSPELSRRQSGFYADRQRLIYRWYKYKEGFSAELVSYLLNRSGVSAGRLLDPFAGTGTALFVAAELGIDADGIELLPIGLQITQVRDIVRNGVDNATYRRLCVWLEKRPWIEYPARFSLVTWRITQGAYPVQTQAALERYLSAVQDESPHAQMLLRFAALCVLESVSYTQKDGQYLRWDRRANRSRIKGNFTKRAILSFDDAIIGKLEQILQDIHSISIPTLSVSNSLNKKRLCGNIRYIPGSCLDIMPMMPPDCYEIIITSPPYCNRYDYTRTYALELAMLGVNEEEIIKMRQNMLSCTVENRTKDLLSMNPKWQQAIEVAEQDDLLQTILLYLDDERKKRKLNNNAIPRMVKNYFYEMSCVIYEMARLLKRGAIVFMVNDNVKYSGVSIPVDLILSAMAEQLGFSVQAILVSPSQKGNSSQQMGLYGYEPLRKCVYIWRKI